MAEKSKILEVLGGKSAELLLMEKVHRALQANERTKYLLTLLQLGLTQAHVQAPDPDDLSVERRRAGIEDAELDRAISSAADHRTGGVYPGRFESSLEEEDAALFVAREWARELGPKDHPLLHAAT